VLYRDASLTLGHGGLVAGLKADLLVHRKLIVEFPVNQVIVCQLGVNVVV